MTDSKLNFFLLKTIWMVPLKKHVNMNYVRKC